MSNYHPRYRFGVAVAPEDPLPGAALIRALRTDPELLPLYPAISAEWIGAALLGEAEAAEPAGTPRSEAGHWCEEADLLIIPVVTPGVLAAYQAALQAGIPVVAMRGSGAEPLLGMGCVWLAAEADLTTIRAAGLRLLEDGGEREAQLRRGYAEARRQSRRPAPGALPSGAEVSGSAPIQACRMPVVPAEPVTGTPELDLTSIRSRSGVTAIIPTRGGPRVHRCVRELRRAAGDLPLQIVLVVSGGLSGSLPPGDELVRAEPPFVWSRANNVGLGQATQPLVLFLNDDCYFRGAGDLQRLARRLDQCGHLTAVAPRGTGFPHHWAQSQARPGGVLQETRFALCGACFLVRREAFAAVGPFDEGFAGYGCDELDWFYRARGEGYSWAVEANVSVEHEGHASFGRSRKEQELPASRARFREKHGIEDLDGSAWDPPRCDLSWVIASRNNAGHLGRSLGSIAAQRHLYPADQEVVLALDGCTDRSAEVALQFNAALPEPLRLRVVSFAEPAGTAGLAKDRAVRLARGEIHLPLDDDDLTLPGRASLLEVLAGDTDVAVGDFWQVGMDGSVALKQVPDVSFAGLCAPGSLNWGLWATAIRRDAWRRYGMHGAGAATNDDLMLWLRWLRDGARFRHLPAETHMYLLRHGSTVFQYDTFVLGEQIRAAYRAGCGEASQGLRGVEADGNV